jgi:E3 ubiquitin-protein ligase HECTD2
MPPWPPRSQSHNPSGTTPGTSSGHIDTNRPLLPLPSTVVEPDIPPLNSRRRAEPEATPSKHGRSFSHPFPFFGGGNRRSEKRNLKNRFNVDSTDDDDSIGDGPSNNSSSVPSRNPSVKASSDPMTGRCMTCDSTVRWPREVRVFRCTICLTVNDLEPYQETDQQPPGPNRKNTHAFFSVPRKRTYRAACFCCGQWTDLW